MVRRVGSLVLTLALAALMGCSTPAHDVPSTTGAPATQTLTGREAFQKLFISARGWASDARPVRLESQSTSDADGRDGKSAVWRVMFASPGRGKLEAFTWSGSIAEGAERGISHGTEDAFNPANSSTQPFDMQFLKSDSDAALATARKNGGEKALKADAKLPVQFLLDFDPHKSQLVWHVIVGQSRNDAKMTIDVDATSGAFQRVEK